VGERGKERERERVKKGVKSGKKLLVLRTSSPF
jgi:hypothetical protein